MQLVTGLLQCAMGPKGAGLMAPLSPGWLLPLHPPHGCGPHR